MSTYRAAGVDSGSANRLVEAITEEVTSTWDGAVVGAFGRFAAGLRVPTGYQNPVFMMTTDGVGTKTEIARMAGKYAGIGFDLVAMCVDDLAAVGARPLAVTDYLVVGRADLPRDQDIIASVAAACREAGCSLLGGETAQHPGTMEPDQFDLAATALGVLDESRHVTGSNIEPGDHLVGLASPNLRANGFSLVRAAVLPQIALDDPFPGLNDSVADVLLEPSVIYAPAVLEVLSRGGVRGLAHITGGGIAGNVARILPEGCRAVVDLHSWQPPPVFVGVQETGSISDDEMLATFNMGVGFVAVVSPEATERTIASFAELAHTAWKLGEIVEGPRRVEFV